MEQQSIYFHAEDLLIDFGANDCIANLNENGWTVIRGFLTARQIQQARCALEPYRKGYRGRERMEGFFTERVYTLIACGKIFEDIAEHPLLMELCDQLLLSGYLLSISQAICLHPGEIAQPLHHDDAFYRVRRPRPAVSLSTIIALDDFNEHNGATEVVSGSHAWSDREVADFSEALESGEVGRDAGCQPLKILLRAGDCLVFHGTLLHRAGANRSTVPRLAITHQYCEPWARTQENFFLALPRSRVHHFSPRIKQLLGYSIHFPNMGHVNARHPLRTLQAEYVNPFESSESRQFFADYWDACKETEKNHVK